MTIAHNLGFPRIGAKRELKHLLEDYWAARIGPEELLEGGRALRLRHWQQQQAAGLDMLPVGDFAWYDHVLNHSMMFGVVPERFRSREMAVPKRWDLDTYFRMARGRAPSGPDTRACEMVKWFDTNYHYIVPEFSPQTRFRLDATELLDEVAQARPLGVPLKPVLLGPLSYLWLGKAQPRDFNPLELLDDLLPVYRELLQNLAAAEIEWVQMDEPILVLDLPTAWQQAFQRSYEALSARAPKILLASYFGGMQDNLPMTLSLPVHGLHLDRSRGHDSLNQVLDELGPEQILSLGVVDGRNIWCCDLQMTLEYLQEVHRLLGDRLWIGPSCSLLHTPVDLQSESGLDEELRSWMSFAVQKIEELAVLGDALKGSSDARKQVEQRAAVLASRHSSVRIRDPHIRARLAAIDPSMSQRQSAYTERAGAQRACLGLPFFPTTTIGSFPQTSKIRSLRRRYRNNELSEQEYREGIRGHIAEVVHIQEELGLDVLVHGEAERNDMVEYFGELLEGIAVTRNGWVQSYGSRCVKPPVIYGDVLRSEPMTLEWIRYAQSLTSRKVKGMLTGPVTILRWSFVRDDSEPSQICRQIALALRDEVQDLEQAGVQMIQIDEPAFREGLPLRRRDWRHYLDWAVQCFRLASCGVNDTTQIHTHMCYSEFNDVIEDITKLDADVITIETFRSRMKLLEVFRAFQYPNGIGPGVYDIHSPLVPEIEEMAELLRAAAALIPPDRLWVNPDCGLKTRQWPETRAALGNMVAAAALLRQEFPGPA